MTLSIIGLIIGVMILAAGLYFFIQDKDDSESRRIYATASGAGVLIGIIAVITLIV